MKRGGLGVQRGAIGGSSSRSRSGILRSEAVARPAQEESDPRVRMEMRIKRDDLVPEMEPNGFQLAGEHAFLEHPFSLIFKGK